MMSAGSTTMKKNHSAFWPVVAGASLAAMVLVVWVISREEGLLKEIVKGTLSVVTTPFFLEATVFFIGISLVVLWNSWRLRREGDGWTYLAEDEPRVRAGQPPGRHDAIFTSPPEPEPPQLDLEQIEGLLDLGSWSEAGELLVQLPENTWDSARVLRCRIRLAEGLGHHEQAEKLRQRQ
jgi:hypothetical protein